MPEGAVKMIRSVNIHYYKGCVAGFKLYDKEGALLLEIETTFTHLGYGVQKVLLAENKVIVGLVAKLFKGE